jgi:transcriptional regulator of acetoin/glycerol metabolism
VDVRNAAEIGAILNLRNRAAGNVSEMARELGVSRSYLYELMAKHGLD